MCVFSLKLPATGAIAGFDFYRQRPLPPWRDRLRLFFRRKNWPRHLLYASAICVGLALGETLPLAQTNCVNCDHAGVDLSDAARSAIAHDGVVPVAGKTPPAYFHR